MADSSAAPDREARIRERRKHVMDKLAALKQVQQSGQAQHGDGEHGQPAASSAAQRQQPEGRRRVARARAVGDQRVTAVRVAAEAAEARHRAAEDTARQALRARLAHEAAEASAARAEVEVRWGALRALEVPQELWEALERQRADCAAIVAAKATLISDMQAALKAKDEAYVALLRRQAEGVDALLGLMAAQAAEVDSAQAEALVALERALEEERFAFMEGERAEVASLLAARGQAEADFLDRVVASAEAYAARLEELRVAEGEDVLQLRAKLEGDVATLQQHLASMRATYQLNTEKLEYNYRVLLERDAENAATISQQKRKLSRQRDVLLALKARYASVEARAGEENTRLTDGYRRVTEQFKDLQAKFLHFERIDGGRLRELWALQQAEAEALARQLLDAGRVITEQQLGWGWLPPHEAVFRSPHDAVPGAAATAAAAAGGAKAAADRQRHHPPPHATELPGSSGSAGSAGSGDEAGEAADGAEASEVAAPKPGSWPGDEVSRRLAAPPYYGALCLLVDEAGFLMEPRAAALVRALPQDERGAVAAASVVRALGVTDGAGFDALMEALTQERDVGKALAEGRPLAPVHADEAVRRLRAFLEAESAAPADATRVGSPFGAAAAAAGGAGDARRAARAAPRSRPPVAGSGKALGCGVAKRAAEREAQYWTRLSGVVDEQQWRVWCALEKHLERYHALLAARARGLDAVQTLRAQNAELRKLLGTYLASDVGTTLQVPPTALL